MYPASQLPLSDIVLVTPPLVTVIVPEWVPTSLGSYVTVKDPPVAPKVVLSSLKLPLLDDNEILPDIPRADTVKVFVELYPFTIVPKSQVLGVTLKETHLPVTFTVLLSAPRLLIVMSAECEPVPCGW